MSKKKRKGAITEHKELAEGDFTAPKVPKTRRSLKRKAAKNDHDADDMMKKKRKKRAAKRGSAAC